MEEQDLILGGEQPTGEEAEYYEDAPNLYDEIGAAYNALSAIAEMDTSLISKEKGRMIRKIKRKALEIIAQNINDIHSEVFGRKDENENEDEEE